MSRPGRRHLAAAGRLEESLSHLHDGAVRAESGIFSTALNLLDAQEATMKELGLPVSDIRWGHVWHQRLVNLYNLRRWDRLGDLAESWEKQRQKRMDGVEASCHPMARNECHPRQSVRRCAASIRKAEGPCKPIKNMNGPDIPPVGFVAAADGPATLRK